MPMKVGPRQPPLLVVATVAAGLPFTAYAQKAPLSTDRPGFSNGTSVVEPSHMVFELGISASPFSSSHATATPELSMRLGINRWLELRWQAPNLVFQGINGQQGKTLDISLSDPSLGFKIARSFGTQIQVSSVTQVSIPLGTAPAGAPKAQYFLDFNLAWQALDTLAIVPNAVITTQWSGDPTQGSHELLGALSLAANWSVNRQLATYVQSVAWFQKPYQENLVLGAGLAYLIRADAQFDFYVDVPVIGSTRNLVFGFGTSQKW